MPYLWVGKNETKLIKSFANDEPQVKRAKGDDGRRL